MSRLKIDRKKITINRPKPGEAPPVLDSLFGAYPAQPIKPLLGDFEYTDDVEKDAADEIEILESFIKQERADLRAQWLLENDNEYWCALIFQSRSQKEEFLEKAGLIGLGDKYLNGLEVAQVLEVDVLPINLPKKRTPKTPKILRSVPTLGERK